MIRGRLPMISDDRIVRRLVYGAADPEVDEMVKRLVGGPVEGTPTFRERLFRWAMRISYTDRPASHATAHAEGLPCGCDWMRS